MSDKLEDIIEYHADRKGALLPLLHDFQAAFGHLSEAHIRHIAAALNLTRAEVYGVVSFYHDYKSAPDPRPVVKLCRAEACQARGVEGLVAGAQAAAGARVKIESIYCLGLCSVGPAALMGEHVYARLDAEKLAALVAAV